MAGDWIKMRDNLWDDPRVSRLCDLVNANEATVIGGLYWLWSNADQHTVDGAMPGLTLSGIDRKTKIKGFGKALSAVGWVADAPDGVTIPRFDEHNGASAKRRASEAKRMAGKRTKRERNAHATRTGSEQDANAVRTESARDAQLEKEKRREDPSTNTASTGSSITPDDRGKSGGEIDPSSPEMLARILAECRLAKVVDTEANAAILGRWVEHGASRSQVATALADARKSIPLGDLRMGYVDTILERILHDDRKARAAADAKIKAADAAIAESKAALANRADPPDGFMAKHVRHA